jgi:hypothetical protein
MKFSIGDTVRFVNEHMDGIVSSIIDEKTLGVTVDNDFEIPVLKTEVVKISFDAYAIPEPAKAREAVQADKGFDENLYASFVQNGEKDIDLYFINHTNNTVFVNYYTGKEGKTIPVFFNFIEGFDYKRIDQLSLENFSNWNNFHFQVMIKPGDKVYPPVVKHLDIPASRFFKHLRATPLLQKQGYLFLINEPLGAEQIQKISQFGVGSDTPVADVKIKAPLSVIDLHIDKIHNNYTQLTKQEVFNLQLSYFERNLEDALAAGLKKVTFIHGVGNLKLKNEIVKVLKQKKGIRQIADAAENEFGYGATNVFFSES